MNLLLLLFLNTFLFLKANVYQCPNYELLNKPQATTQQEISAKPPLQCRFFMTNPKKVINPYRNDILNHVQSKPFGSICFKCSMCLAIAREVHKIFAEISNANRENKQEEVVEVLKENIKEMCHHGFDNYDLRKFKHISLVTDEFACSTHVRTKMDGQWTEKLREMCKMYSDYIDHQFLLNDYLNGTEDIANYLCRNDGVFRDCASLDFKTNEEDEAAHTCTDQ